MRTTLTRGAGAAFLRALLDHPTGLTTSQVADLTHYARNTLRGKANLAEYDRLIYPAATAPGSGAATVWAIEPARRAEILAALDQGNPR